MGSKKTVTRTALASANLTDQQRIFVLELMANHDFNPTEAAKKAGYKNPSVQASRLLAKPEIAKFLKQKQTRREQKLEIKAERVVQELANMAFRNIKDFCDEDGRIRTDNLHAIPDHAAVAIDGIKQRHDTYWDGEHQHEVVTYELKLVPKLAAIEALMKHMGIDKPQASTEGEQEVNTRPIVNWDEYYAASQADDPVEAEIRKAAGLLPAPGPIEPELIDNRDEDKR